MPFIATRLNLILKNISIIDNEVSKKLKCGIIKNFNQITFLLGIICKDFKLDINDLLKENKL